MVNPEYNTVDLEKLESAAAELNKSIDTLAENFEFDSSGKRSILQILAVDSIILEDLINGRGYQS